MDNLKSKAKKRNLKCASPIQRLKRPPKTLRKSRTIRFDDSEWAKVEVKAALYCDGNTAEWVRYCATNMMPKKKDMERLK